MKKIISIFLLVGMALSVFAQEHTKLGYSFENTSFHFGDVEQWDNPLATFTFTNKSKNEMLILPSFNENDLKVITPNQAIKPNETAVITAIYYTASNGSFNRKFPIYFSQLTEPIYLTLSGNIKTLSESAYIQCPMAKPETTKTKVELTGNVAEGEKREVKIYPLTFEYDAKNNIVKLDPKHLDQSFCDLQKKPTETTRKCCEVPKKAKELDRLKAGKHQYYRCVGLTSAGKPTTNYAIIKTYPDNTKTDITVIRAMPLSGNLAHYVLGNQDQYNGKILQRSFCAHEVARFANYNRDKDEFTNSYPPQDIHCSNTSGDETKGLCSYVLKAESENATEKDWINLKNYLETTQKQKERATFNDLYYNIYLTRNELKNGKHIPIPRQFKPTSDNKIPSTSLDILFKKTYEGLKDELNKKLITDLKTAKEKKSLRSQARHCRNLMKLNGIEVQEKPSIKKE